MNPFYLFKKFNTYKSFRKQIYLFIVVLYRKLKTMNKKKRNFDIMISTLNRDLFAKIVSQTHRFDKTSLLALQNAIRNSMEYYVYLEIGSHLGGSIQTHLLDPKCKKIYSIDKRLKIQPDNRCQKGYKYPKNSTKRMLNNLKQISINLNKITCFDDDASNIDISKIDPKPDICLIDGEHTTKAVISDFNFCLSVLNDNGVIIFHDSHILRSGINVILHNLKKKNIVFRAYNLPRNLILIELRNNCIFKKDKKLKILKIPVFNEWVRQFEDKGVIGLLALIYFLRIRSL